LLVRCTCNAFPLSISDFTVKPFLRKPSRMASTPWCSSTHPVSPELQSNPSRSIQSISHVGPFSLRNKTVAFVTTSRSLVLFCHYVSFSCTLLSLRLVLLYSFVTTSRSLVLSYMTLLLHPYFNPLILSNLYQGCEHCKEFAPIYERAADKMVGKVLLAKALL